VSTSERVVVAAPAKINFCLHAGTRRADGYHDLESLVAFAAIGDVITVARDDDISMSVEGPFAAGLTSGEDNLVLRAARLTTVKAKIEQGIRICLTKNLPVASGLGGGSADAAAVLRALVRLWHLDLSASELQEIAASLGADVPVCSDSLPAWMEGKGERITRLPALPEFRLLLVNPGVALPTGQVFAALRDRRGLGFPYPKTGFKDVAALLRFLQATTNDLEVPARAIAPVIGDVLGEMADMPGALFVRMSGSGATCFGIFERDYQLRKAAQLLAMRHRGWWIKETALASENAAMPAFIQ